MCNEDLDVLTRTELEELVVQLQARCDQQQAELGELAVVKTPTPSLEHTNELFTKTFESQRSAILILDSSVPPNIIKVNPAFTRIFQYVPEATIGRTTAFLHVSEQTLAECQSNLHAQLENAGVCHQPNFHMRRKDGTVFPADITISPLLNDEDQRIGWVSVVDDITDEKQAEHALRESEALYRTLFEKNLNPIAIINRNGTYLDANQAYLDFVERDREELLKMTVFDFTPPEDVLKRKDEHIPAWETGGTLETEYLIDGKTKFQELTITPIRYHGVDAVVGIGREVTERRRAERALRLEHAQLMHVLGSLDAIVYVVDMRSHRLLFTNSFMRERLGAEIGEKCYRFFGPNPTRPCPFCKKQELANDEGPESHCSWEHFDDRGKRWYHCHSQAIRWIDGTVARLQIATDVTERKEADNRRLEFDRQLERARRLESLALMAGGIAHDFNNLLTTILGNLELLADHLPPRSDSRELLQDVQLASKQAATLSGQMLAYTGKMQASLAPLNITKFLYNVRGSAQSDLELIIDVDGPLPDVLADEMQLQQVVENLMANAAEAYGPGRGKLVIEARQRTLTRSFFQQCVLDEEQPEGRYVLLSFTDHAGGIDDEVLPHVFEPFFSTKFIGRGLGLAVVQGIVSRHRGGVCVSTVTGQSTTITVALPVVDAR